MQMKLSIVVPIFKSERFLERLLQDVDDSFQDFSWAIEIILVDDASPDNSWLLIRNNLERSFKNLTVRAIRLPKNMGQHRAIGYGVANSRGVLIATVDADLQEGLRDLRKLLVEITTRDVDVAQSVRVVDSNNPAVRVPSRIYFGLLRIVTGRFGAQNYGSLSVFRADLKEDYLIWNRKGLHHNAALEMISDRRARIGIEREMRDGPSSYSLTRRLRHAVAGFRGYEARIATFVNGFAFVIFCVATIALCVSLSLQLLSGGLKTPVGWLSIMAFMSFNSFLNLMSLRLATTSQKVFPESEAVEVLDGSEPSSSL